MKVSDFFREFADRLDHCTVGDLRKVRLDGINGDTMLNRIYTASKALRKALDEPKCPLCHGNNPQICPRCSDGIRQS